MSPSIRQEWPICNNCDSPCKENGARCVNCGQLIGPGYNPRLKKRAGSKEGTCAFCGNPAYSSLDDLIRKETICISCRSGSVRCDSCQAPIPGVVQWPTGIHQCWPCFTHGRGAGRLNPELLEAIADRVPKEDEVLFSIGRRGLSVVALTSGVLLIWRYFLGSQVSYKRFQDLAAIEVMVGEKSSVVMLKTSEGERIRAIELFEEERDAEKANLERLRKLLETASGFSEGLLGEGPLEEGYDERRSP